MHVLPNVKIFFHKTWRLEKCQYSEFHDPWSFSEFGFQINSSYFKKTNVMPAQELHICYCIYVWNSFENWHMVVQLSVYNIDFKYKYRRGVYKSKLDRRFIILFLVYGPHSP